ncbi:helix-turn-helix domain-containing protein [Microbacterium sp. BWR-S6Y]|uniref:helix-turn-helix transcriptional regulator n=1 Tax=Microbacterium sp. BWR-S6Y TaxID=3232073 RepID=UPI0035286221
MNASVNMSPPPALLTQREVVGLLGVSHRTLEDWRLTKTGPAFVKLGHRTVRYTADDVHSFIQAARRG